MTTRKLTGNLIDTRGKAQAAAEVWLSAAGRAAAATKTDAEGGFEFLIEDDWPAGRYRLEAPPTEKALSASRMVTIEGSGPPAPQVLAVAPRYEVSARAGWIFMLAMILALVVVAGLYFDWHAFSLADLKQGEPPAAEHPITPQLSAAVDTALEQVLEVEAQAEAAAAAAAAALAEAAVEEAAGAAVTAQAAEDEGETGEVEGEVEDDQGEEGEGEEAEETGNGEPEEEAADAGQAEPARAPTLAGSGVQENLAIAAQLLKQAAEERGDTLRSEKILVVQSLIDRARSELGRDDLAALKQTLAALQTEVKESGRFFWEEWPEILLETLFWALGATLIRLIFSTGTYIYKRTFLANAIPRYLGLLVSVPILAVLISFVLSLVEISIELSDLKLELDMGNPYIAILVAALIGFAPWKAWDFLQDLADALFTRLGRLFGGGGAAAA